jgi:chorismate mutase
MSKKLEEIRKKIDELDNTIHDTLMERAALIVDVAEEKRKKGLDYVQPAREAIMIRRLLERHQGALPAQAVVRIWRELVGAVSLMQTGLKITVTNGAENAHLWEMARDYFGSVVPMQRASNALNAVSTVREQEASFAVLPWPVDGDENPWWSYLFTQQDSQQMKIVCALPYGITEGKNLSPQERALVLARIEYSPSGDDRTFIALEADFSISRTRIINVFTALGLPPITLNTRSKPDAFGHSLHLVEVGDYLSVDDERLTRITEAFEGLDAKCFVLGGYPLPPVYKRSRKN